jgi:hypothetical protein
MFYLGLTQEDTHSLQVLVITDQACLLEDNFCLHSTMVSLGAVVFECQFRNK